MIRLSPVLAGLGTYPFVKLDEARARLRAAGVDIIDFGMGEPRFAHTRDEQVSVDALVRSYEVL